MTARCVLNVGYIKAVVVNKKMLMPIQDQFVVQNILGEGVPGTRQLRSLLDGCTNVP